MSRQDGVLMFLAAIIGLAGGLYYAWQISPVSYTDTAPSSLRADFKADYLALVASAYAGSGDVSQAQSRLLVFADPDMPGTLAALAQQRLAQGWPEAEARSLAQLAAALSTGKASSGSPPGPLALVTPSGPAAGLGTPTATRTQTPFPSPAPTRTPTPTPGAPFRLASRDKVCDPKLTQPLLEVDVTDAAGQPVPGIEVRVVWDSGQDHFFTGLKPEIGIGYGDFTMTPGITYSLQLADSDQPVTGLSAEDCTGVDGKTYPGSWHLRFEQPPH
jgi:hypothetical protein